LKICEPHRASERNKGGGPGRADSNRTQPPTHNESRRGGGAQAALGRLFPATSPPKPSPARAYPKPQIEQFAIVSCRGPPHRKRTKGRGPGRKTSSENPQRDEGETSTTSNIQQRNRRRKMLPQAVLGRPIGISSAERLRRNLCFPGPHKSNAERKSKIRRALPVGATPSAIISGGGEGRAEPKRNNRHRVPPRV